MKRTLATALLICGAALFSRTQGLADDYTPSDLTASQIFTKAGAAEGRLPAGAYTILERSHGGGMDTTIATHISGKNSLSVVTSGPFTHMYGYYEGQSWWQDANGQVILRSNFRAKEDPNTLAWEHPDDPKYNVRVLGITSDAPHEYVVEANPPNGTDEYAYYDATTMHLVRVVTWARDRHKHVTDYDDYRTAFGQTRAYHTHSTDGRSDNDTDSWITSISLDPSPPAMAIPPSRPMYTLPSNAPVVIPATFTTHGIVIRATIAGRGLDMILDSGASTITLDPGVVHDLALASYGKSTGTIGGEVDRSMVMVPHMTIGALSLDNVQVSGIAFNSQADSTTRAVGLLGCDFIGGGVIGIDFLKQTVTVYPRDGFDPAAVGATVVQPLETDDCLPRVSASIEGISGNFLIDTGAFTTVVFDRFLGKIPSHAASSGVSGITGVGGSISARTILVNDFVFGGIRYEQAQVVIPESSIWDVSDYDGVVGRNALAHYAIFLDYANRKVYFAPAK